MADAKSTPEEMMNENPSKPPVLTCVLFNSGGLLQLHDEHLGEQEFEGLRWLLRLSGGSIDLSAPPCPVQLSWMGQHRSLRQNGSAEFMICRRDAPLLFGGLAANGFDSGRLWRWLVFLKRATFRCLDEQPSALAAPPTCPWLGLILMPESLDLDEPHLDALYDLGQTVGQVWLRHHFRARSLAELRAPMAGAHLARTKLQRGASQPGSQNSSSNEFRA